MAAMKRCLVLLVVTLGAVGPAQACVVEYWAVFTDARGPDAPLDAFAGGRLGVLLPSYASAYLAVAYRHLSGHPLDDEEVRAAVGLWQRLGSTPTPNPSDLIRPWMDARAIVAGRPYQEIRLERQIGPGQWYANCLADAFVRAAETLRSRAAIFGADSAGVRAWIDAQDTVFANCNGGLRLPAAPEPDLAPMLAADRATRSPPRTSTPAPSTKRRRASGQSPTIAPRRGGRRRHTWRRAASCGRASSPVQLIARPWRRHLGSHREATRVGAGTREPLAWALHVPPC